jgi:hypothetical protein
MKLTNAHHIIARWSGPTDTRDGAFNLSWQGQRLGRVTARMMHETGRDRQPMALGEIAAHMLTTRFMCEHDTAVVTAETVSVADMGSDAYSIHVHTRWA